MPKIIITTTNKVIRLKLGCANCVTNKSLFLKKESKS